MYTLSAFVTKCFQYYVLGKEVMAVYFFIYQTPPCINLSLYIKSVKSLSSRICFSSPKLFLELTNIHIFELDIMECKHAPEGINSYLTCHLLQKHINYLFYQNNFHQHQGGQHQVELPHQNLDYLQDIPHHRNVLVTHHHRNPHRTYSLFCKLRWFLC